MNITIRNIPEDVIDKIRTISKMQRRSLNNEILIVLERGIEIEEKHYFNTKRNINKNIQIDIWNRLSGEWDDNRETDEIINDIYTSRTIGREFKL